MTVAWRFWGLAGRRAWEIDVGAQFVDAFALLGEKTRFGVLLRID